VPGRRPRCGARVKAHRVLQAALRRRCGWGRAGSMDGASACWPRPAMG